jgi:twinkle protein
VTPNDREIVITEGEIDAFTIAGWGRRALSIPRGVNALRWLEHDYEALEQFERIYLCTDMDPQGEKCAAEIAQRLGRTRCFRIHLPHKDANEALLAGFDGPDFYECFDAAKTLDPPELRGVEDFADDAWESLHPTQQKFLGTEPPINLPWRCRHGEVTLWCGINGHGKSQLLLQFAIHDASQGERVCIASLEIAAGDVVGQLVRMGLGMMPTKDARLHHDEAIRWLAPSFWLVNHVGVMHWRKLLPLLEYAAKRYGCSRFIVDSLVRCGIGEDDYDEQKAFVGELTGFAGQYGHVHLVAHPRKGSDEKASPGKMDVRGSGTIADLVHNGFTVWRNKDKEEKLAALDVNNFQARMALEAHKDGQLSIWKQRKTGEEPFRPIWLHKPSGQFLSRPDELPRKYIV